MPDIDDSDRNNKIDHVHLIFKTHLDLGFTDFAREVLHRYLTDFIPHALALARRLREEDPAYRFVWTTGSWLIDTYLEQSAPSDRRAMEAAILAGDIAWHGLPFTTHSELMDADLFRFGLGLSQQLDARFGRHTIAAKMTDVPGHTRGIVPLLAEAGIEFLHIGVNEASPVPDVPPLFLWLDQDSGQSVIVMYHASYGHETVVPELGTALAIASTGDNIGPPTESDVVAQFRQIQQMYPSAQVHASTLDAFALELRAIRHTLPVITAEIGDTWIHGVGSDPTKVRQFRALSRLRQQWIQNGQLKTTDPAYQTFSKRLLCVPEHTWGLDNKTYLANYTDYTADELSRSLSRTDFQRMAASWEEQRRYLTKAVEALADTTLYAEALDVLQTSVPVAAGSELKPVPDKLTFETPQFDIGFDPVTGAMNHLKNRHDGRIWAAESNPLGLFRYETFSQADYDRFWEEFIRNRDKPDVREWAIYDYTKRGIAGKADTNRLIPAQLIGFHRIEEEHVTRFALDLKSPPELATRYGAPIRLHLEIVAHHAEPRLSIRLSWNAKQSCRLPEAAWLSFQPIQAEGATWAFEKLGAWIDPLDVVSCGNRTLHAINDRIRYRDSQSGFTLQTFDAPLIAPGEPALLRFPNTIPDLRGGVHVNLFNNVWATNFPQWIEGPATFNFDLMF